MIIPKRLLTTYALIGLSSLLSAITWTGGAGDGEWNTATNWDAGVTPSPNEIVNISNGDSVNIPSNDFNLPGGITVNVTGNSQLTNTTAAAYLYNGMTFNFSSGSGLSGAFIDVIDGTLNFQDGATLTPNFILHRGTTTYGITLGTDGFSTLTPNILFDTGSENWSDFVFNIDVTAYDYNTHGLNIDLIDWGSHGASYDGTFNPTLNIIDGGAGISGVLSFDAASSKISLFIDPPGNDAPLTTAQSYTLEGNTPLSITLEATDLEGDPLTYSVVTPPTNGTLTGTPPNLTYTYTGTDYTIDSFTYKANDGVDDSNISTITLAPIPQSSVALWESLQSKIENDPLNAATHTTWTEPHATNVGETITISRITYELGTLTGTQHTATPTIAAYYARPTTGSNFPAVVQNHGGGQFASSPYAKFWAEQGYAALCINWGGLNLEERNPNEPASSGSLHPNTYWDGLAAGFFRPSTTDYPMENPVTEAIFRAGIDPATFSDGQTLYDVPHPLNSSWVLNGYAVRRAITYLTSLPEVNANKVGVFGFSMGGRTTIMSSTDPRITVLAPAVGGTGFLTYDYWGLPDTASSTQGWTDIELFRNTVAGHSYWPHISAPVMFLNASNDFNAPFDLATRCLTLHETGLNDVSPKNILSSQPHNNHRLSPEYFAARIHWLRHYLHEDLEFPEISDSELEMSTADGVPRFKVYPDTSTSFPITRVEIYYGHDRDSRRRFWRNAPAVDMGTHWEAPLPIFDAKEMLVAHAVITYDVGFTQEVAFSLPTNLMSVASKVHTYYPDGVDPSYLLPATLDTPVHQFHVLDADVLVENGLLETAEVEDHISSPSGADGFIDWFVINEGNSGYWQYFTRKINDPSWTGGEGAQLTFGLTADAANTLVIKLIVDRWFESAQTTYFAYVPITSGLNQVSLSLSDFKLADNVTTLSSWDRANHIGFSSGQSFQLTNDSWAGSLPVLENLAWSGGDTILDNGVSTSWLKSYNLPTSNEQTRANTDGDALTEWEEFIAGTDPTDAASTFRTCFSSDGSSVTLEWDPVVGKTYDIEHSTDLGSSDPWGIYQQDVQGGVITIPLPVLSNGLKNFYRVSVRP